MCHQAGLSHGPSQRKILFLTLSCNVKKLEFHTQRRMTKMKLELTGESVNVKTVFLKQSIENDSVISSLCLKPL